VWIINSADIRLANLQLINNSAAVGGAIHVYGAGLASNSLTIERCVFSNNQADDPAIPAGSGSAGSLYAEGANIVIRDSLFSDGVALARGGAIRASSCDLDISGTRFTNNQAGFIIADNLFFPTLADSPYGGAMHLWGTSARLVNCRFDGNVVIGKTAWGGAVSTSQCDDLIFTNCVFWRNSNLSDAGSVASALLINADTTTLTNCSIAGNWISSSGPSSDPPETYEAAVVWQAGTFTITNSIIAFNGGSIGGIGDPSDTEDCGPNFGYWANPPTEDEMILRHTCVYPLNTFGLDFLALFYTQGFSFYAEDPGFETGWTGTGILRLSSTSPMLDFGSSFVDTDPTTPGVQLLPEDDILGGARITDGDNDGVPTVDAGAYEFQASGMGL